MAAVWKGFTEEDIGLYQKDKEEKNEKPPSSNKIFSLSKSGEQKAMKQKLIYQSLNQSSTIEKGISESAKLYKEPEESVPLNDGKEKKKRKESGNEKTASASLATAIGTNSICLKVVEGKAYELVDRNTAETSKADLDIFEARQKKLEEQNKKKKEMLAKIISDRKKQTSEEAKRLQQIQEELQKLDVLLSSDVGILRNKIEEASFDFAEAQKRYNKAEKEFLGAKQNLFVKLEKKELLTKLLCTIIEQNELRKAQKLSELMEKLEVKENGKAENSTEILNISDLEATTNKHSLTSNDLNQPS